MRDVSHVTDEKAKERWRLRNPRPKALYDGAGARRLKAERERDAEEWIAMMRSRTPKGTK